MSWTSLILHSTWIVLFLIKLVVAKDECYTNADCYNNFKQLRIVCCKNARDVDRYCQPYNCEGRYCLTHGDCGGEGACCMDNKCTNSQDCPRCNSSADCAVSEYCCTRVQGNVCRRSCVGERCDENNYCTGPEEYCDSDKVCAKSTSSTKTSAPKQTTTSTLPGCGIGFIVTGIVLTIFGAILCHLLYRIRKMKSRREVQNDQGMVEAAQVENTGQTSTRPPQTLPQTQPDAASTGLPTPRSNSSYDGHAANDPNTSQQTRSAVHAPMRVNITMGDKVTGRRGRGKF